MGRRIALVLALILLMALPTVSRTTVTNAPAQRAEAQKLQQGGRWKESVEILRTLILDPHADPRLLPTDLRQAGTCYWNLGLYDEFDALREDAVGAHPANWRLLQTAAELLNGAPHYGYIVAGTFTRYQSRGGGDYAQSTERDRVRALQLMVQAMEHQQGDPDVGALGSFYLQFASLLAGNNGPRGAWRLQYLTDLTVLPDYELGYNYGGREESLGAAVDSAGNPVLHRLPPSFEQAASDGERWRWALARAAAVGPSLKNEADYLWAEFLHGQFGVQTMAGGDLLKKLAARENDAGKPGPWSLESLGEDETIARLATGVKRFKLSGEYNPIAVFRRLADGHQNRSAEAFQRLATIFADRRQYDKAAEIWRRNIAELGQSPYKQESLDQIVGNWGSFEPVGAQAAGQSPTVDYRFRNGSKVHFTAREILVKNLLDDVRVYLESNPSQLAWEKVEINNIGWRVFQRNESKYLGRQTATWDLGLDPRPHHFDRRLTVTVPLKQGGAHLVTAKMENGNTSATIIWLDDTAIVTRPLARGNLVFVADARSGAPIANSQVDFFGWRQDYVSGKRYKVSTTDFSRRTGPDGTLVLGPSDMSDNLQWLITATTPAGGFAHLGFTNYWYNERSQENYRQEKEYSITDRPVYRPGQPVKFKIWLGLAEYTAGDQNPYAGLQLPVTIKNPRGEKVFSSNFKVDRYGGLDGEFTLPADAALGVYGIVIQRNWEHGIGSFRVEEYKKPEFEVSVKAPEKPVMLGDKVRATIKASYYFGAPVTSATVKYKVLRYEQSVEWYPWSPWDWLYGPGYWWFAADYDWYPGWRIWGCKAPRGWWWPHQSPQPEVVAENEVPIGADGTVAVEIDTTVARELYGDTDHRYEISAEVRDESRRTIVGTGSVLVARQPFQTAVWVDRGWYRTGDTVRAGVAGRTLDGKPVQGKLAVRLYRIAYVNGRPVESAVRDWALETNAEGRADVDIKASQAGQYRLSCTLTDGERHAVEGGYLFTVRGEGSEPSQFRFNDLELLTDKREYAPGEKVRLLVNTEQPGSTVLLFVNPANGIYPKPLMLRLEGKSTEVTLDVGVEQMPNFFVEGVTISGGRIHSVVREIVVPPEKKILNVEVLPNLERYRPGAKARVGLKITGPDGKPYQGSLALVVYDKSVEYISGGSNVPEMKAFFWKWRRGYNQGGQSSLGRHFWNLDPPGAKAMSYLGAFGAQVADEEGNETDSLQNGRKDMRARGGGMPMPMAAAAPALGAMKMAGAPMEAVAEKKEKSDMGADKPASSVEGPLAEPSIRKEFADTAFWAGNLETDKEGRAAVEFAMPENLTAWKFRCWGMAPGTRVGEGTAEAVTAKDLILRLQAPRFFVEKDEVVLSANIHNYLAGDKQVKAVLELEGGSLEAMGATTQTVTVKAGGERRVDWRVKAVREGEAVVRMKALADEESDAMEMRFPVRVHGMDKVVSFSGALRPEEQSSTFTLNVPAERRIDASRLEIRWSPTLAGALVDALPYLVSYPYGCTEQTLNRFLPTVVTQRVLQRLGIDLKSIRDKRANLNAQEIGDDKKRAEDWKRQQPWNQHEPVFDEAEVARMARAGIERLASMQLSDGGWGWFSGWGEHSYPHTTALVVHGLQVARENETTLPGGMLERGIAWLEKYQGEQVELLRNAEKKKDPYKLKADNLDALVFMILADEGRKGGEMLGYLWRDRLDLSIYGRCLYGMALYRQNEQQKLAELMKTIEQFLVEDEENQTAYLRLPAERWWWFWYGDDIESQVSYLKLLALTDPKGRRASRLVKYILNNRKHATYWNSTRDTAFAIEALATYLKASGEEKPDMTVEVLIDGKKVKESRITAENLFAFDNSLVLEGKAVEGGSHRVEIRRTGRGPLYWNAYLSYFSLEDFITKAGLEIKVERAVYRLNKVDATRKSVDTSGRPTDQKVEKYERELLPSGAEVKSGDLLEIELTMDSKNDYEYVIFEDLKAAGCEPVEVRSGYQSTGPRAYVEFRDERVSFFMASLARGRQSVAYRLRAETPGKFSALPARGFAMYAPELRANSDEMKLGIRD